MAGDIESEATDVWKNLANTADDKADESGDESGEDGDDLIESVEQIFPFSWLFGKPRKRQE